MRRLELDEFVRTVGVAKKEYCVFLGAGASMTSGVPSAESCIWEWKRNIFLTKNPGLESQFSELSLPDIRRRIQEWLDSQHAFPPEGSSDEYGVYIEKCFPLEDSRRAFFAEFVRIAVPHTGYKMLCALAEAGIVTHVYTTNFDGLTARAAGSFQVTPFEVGPDSQNRLDVPRHRGHLMCLSLHGDYRYDRIKNTPQELQKGEERLLQHLQASAKDCDLIVSGYSGRDESVMTFLEDAYSRPGCGSLFWCGFGSDVPERVWRLLEIATANGRQTFYIPTSGFDDLMVRLGRHCLPEDKRQALEQLLSKAVAEKRSTRTAFDIPDLPSHSIVKSNAFRMELPKEVFAFDLTKWPEEGKWAWLESICAGHRIVAVPHRQVLALGCLNDIASVFRDYIAGEIHRSPVGEKEVLYADGTVISLFLRALVCSLAESDGLETDRKHLLWEIECHNTVRTEAGPCSVHRAASLYLRPIARDIYLILKPTLVLKMKDGSDLDADIQGPTKAKLLASQYNKQFNQEVNRWRTRLFPNRPTTVVEYPTNVASGFRFGVKNAPAFANIGAHSRQKALVIDDRIRSHVKHKGTLLQEPCLRFSTSSGEPSARDVHPLRGLIQNRPFDFPLTQTGLRDSISLGVISPRAEAERLYQYLNRCAMVQTPAATERDYLLDYPGFSRTFRIPLEIPSMGSTGWEVCAEPDTTAQPLHAARTVGHNLIRAIQQLISRGRVDVVLVFIPERWRTWRQYVTESERFDLHDFVKAFAVQQGVSTQFLEEDTLSHSQQCRVWWWLSLALYVKAMRTPWVLEKLDPDSAFVGLGFSVAHGATRGEHITLGCSHLYNSRGQGLQYRVGKVEKVFWRRGNPFMSRGDAQRMGETIRQLFFESHYRLPERVVLHKRTPFSKDEREGLMEGLADVTSVEMIELNIDNALRYVSSVPVANGGFSDALYPVRRGTLIKLDDFTALLWVHGVTDALQPGRQHYQGKRRIPAPVVIRRHLGTSDVSTVAEEILGLSKMDWNSADLYSKLPATIESCNKIAQISHLLERFGPVSYDYRLFI